MIYKGKQYARIFFKRDSDKERCIMPPEICVDYCVTDVTKELGY